MVLECDQAAAAAFVRTAESVRSTLLDQRILLDTAIGTALTDFAGPYAQVFVEGCHSDSDDYVTFVHALGVLADDVQAAALQAQKESERLQDLAAWRVREEEREVRRRQSAVTGVPALDDGFWDPMPSDRPLPAPEVSVSFFPVLRPRSSRGRYSGQSSAYPEKLRVFVTQARSSGAALTQALQQLSDGWARFVSSCGWVKTGSSAFLGGFGQLIEENHADAAWIEQIAAAFAAAGSGSLSVQTLDLVQTRLSPAKDQQLLLALSTLPAEELTAMFAASPELAKRLNEMGPAMINSWWEGLNDPNAADRFSARQELLLTTFPQLMGNLEGIPYRARDHANTTALHSMLSSTQAESETVQRELFDAILGHERNPIVIADLLRRRDELEERESHLKNIELALIPTESATPRFLVSLTQDHPPLAAVSVGDLDTATNVTYAVPGMNTTTTDMDGWTKGAQNLQSSLGAGSAVVAWIGYKAPSVMNVSSSDAARAGGAKLASALKGLDAVRHSSLPRRGILAYSYGTTAAAFALIDPEVHVDTFVTLGSAGLPDFINTADKLHADKVYSGQALDIPLFLPGPGDRYAWMGRQFSEDHHVDPVAADFGSHIFGVGSGGDAGRPVTTHDALVSDDGKEAGYLDQKTESLRNTVRALRGEEADLTPVYVPSDIVIKAGSEALLSEVLPGVLLPKALSEVLPEVVLPVPFLGGVTDAR
ncbi:alpha/beta hydrolase [Rathayibacter toxicus]|uniref:alpha/beta hydrolase n=1 Tax=Rathayibacter toxicus TaxID=145458 RepID=UPI000CE78E54|nr:alpha/beta hydrolase [Rathayibacter toxicus]PPI53041.1 hypothetical protein C5D35_08820 [Rathayibacter toxicus]QOD10880.1 hypothetical protein BSG36_02635 [Rathayibacter toxicus]QWL27620.1 hypothetical protein E2R33_02630 [Rathayibacter toxicus]